MRSDDKYAGQPAPDPTKGITQIWQEKYELNKESEKQRRAQVQETFADKRQKFYAMYCPECREWNGEPGEFPGYCKYCEAKLEVK